MFDITAFKRPLDSHLHKRYIERLAYMLLAHIFPKFASTLILQDSPDLQTKDKSIGIEITEAISPEIAQIDGEYTKLRFGKKAEREIENCKQLIEKNGGEIDSIGLSYPVTNSKDEWNIFSNALKKKLKLLPSYREKGFKKIGLFIFFNEPPIPFDPKVAMERFTEIQKNSIDKYDFLLFGYHNGVIVYDFSNMSHKIYHINQDAFDNLSLCARKLVKK